MGRDDAFERLFDEQYDRCAHVAQRIVHDPETAGEVAAEAFARAWARWPRISAGGGAAGWVLRVSVNLAIDVTRRKRPPAPSAVHALSPAEAATQHVALVAALRSLPRRQREAIALRYLADLSEADVSTAMGVSAGSVKTHLHRGLAHLRSSLGADRDLEVDLAN